MGLNHIEHVYDRITEVAAILHILIIIYQPIFIRESTYYGELIYMYMYTLINLSYRIMNLTLITFNAKSAKKRRWQLMDILDKKARFINCSSEYGQ